VASIREFNLVKLFVGILLSDLRLLPDAERLLTEDFGPLDLKSPVIPFSFTKYYEKEMGPSLQRIFLSFERLIVADRLPEIKRKTNTLEEELAKLNRDVARPANLDPGYIEHAKVILASTKNFYHRMYLGGGIFGEVTMHFRDNAFCFFPWTYPDYQSEDYLQFFLALRQIYREQLRTMCIAKH